MINSMTTVRTLSALAIAAGLTLSASAQIELTTNGNFETGDLTGWTPFVAPPGSDFVVTGDAFAGSSAGYLSNTNPGTAALVKQANIGIGQVSAFEEVTISFWAKGTPGVAGVQFAEFFSELSGGGTSSSVILGGGALSTSSDWSFYQFTTTTGSDVSGGVTLQFNAATGAVQGSTSELFIDNVSVSIVPEPASLALMGLAGLTLMARRRRKA